jgi:hypothetical protein
MLKADRRELPEKIVKGTQSLSRFVDPPFSPVAAKGPTLLYACHGSGKEEAAGR